MLHFLKVQKELSEFKRNKTAQINRLVQLMFAIHECMRRIYLQSSGSARNTETITRTYISANTRKNAVKITSQAHLAYAWHFITLFQNDYPHNSKEVTRVPFPSPDWYVWGQWKGIIVWYDWWKEIGDRGWANQRRETTHDVERLLMWRRRRENDAVTSARRRVDKLLTATQWSTQNHAIETHAVARLQLQKRGHAHPDCRFKVCIIILPFYMAAENKYNKQKLYCSIATKVIVTFMRTVVNLQSQLSLSKSLFQFSCIVLNCLY